MTLEQNAALEPPSSPSLRWQNVKKKAENKQGDASGNVRLKQRFLGLSLNNVTHLCEIVYLMLKKSNNKSVHER